MQKETAVGSQLGCITDAYRVLGLVSALAQVLEKEGGGEDELFSALKDDGVGVKLIASFLLGESQIVPRPLRDVALDKKASPRLRARAIVDLNDQCVAFEAFPKDAGKDTTIATACLLVMKNEEELLTIALKQRNEVGTEAAKKMQNKRHLLDIALNSSWEATVQAAVSKLDGEELTIAARQVRFSEVRSEAIERITDREFLHERLSASTGEQHSFVRDAVRRRLRQLGERT